MSGAAGIVGNAATRSGKPSDNRIVHIKHGAEVMGGTKGGRAGAQAPPRFQQIYAWTAKTTLRQQ
ncbi:hypothetical protein QJS04_geneDACA012420 [Acorus gramineus]|uniref:Uncharacterized protein n=1 Tax=Acorus gramineus TaxID=55184 RepID=A0AAV9B983_ACOGR|nr:hypothetical protein QJS04_geneDACA012420 [Acorus gramineus]